MSAAALAGRAPRAALRAVAAALAQAGCPDAAFDAAQLLARCLHTRADPRVLDAPLTDAQAGELAALTARRAAREPLQYILGEWSFMGLRLAVGPGVLCPRPDSEAVCEAALELLAGRRAPRVLDLCAGSGCLGVAVRHARPDAQVLCVEKEDAAFAYLRVNAAAGGVQAVQADIRTWHRTLPGDGVDLILCNPPYLTAAEMAVRMPETAAEPAAALDGGPDGLDFYRLLLRHYRRPLRPGGWMVLEIGASQGKAVCGMARQAGWRDVGCRQDLAGRDRAVCARR